MIGYPPLEAAAGAARPLPRMRERWRTVLRHRHAVRFRRALRWFLGFFPLTLAGLSLLAISALAIWLEGIEHLDLVILVTGITLGVIIALMWLLVTGAAIHLHLGLKRSATRSPLEMECDVFQWTGFQVRFNQWIPCVIAEWRWNPWPDGQVEMTLPREELDLVETVRPHQRGIFSQVTRRVTVRDILGLCSVSWDVAEKVDVEIFPSRGKLDNMAVLSALFWGDDISDPRGEPSGDRVDMRQYAHGDSPRMILWKVYARSRKLMVRIPERAITARPRACAYFVSGDATEPVAGLCRVILERNLLGEGWRFGADGSTQHAVRLQEALRVLARSGNPPDDVEPGAGLAAFLAGAQKDGYSSCFLFVPSLPGPWLAHVTQALARTPLRISLFMGSDHLVEAPPKEPRWYRLVLQPTPPPGPGLEEMTTITRQLARSVAEVWRVDRKAGRLFTDTNYR